MTDIVKIPFERILVTGAAGKIGRATLDLLAHHGTQVTALSQRFDGPVNADRVLTGDTREPDVVARALDDVDAVIHLAAIPHKDAGTPFEVYSTNVLSTFNVLHQSGERGVRAATIASSINAYGLPMNHHDVYPAYFPLDEDIPAAIDDWYSLSKNSDESTARMAHSHWGISVVALRLPFVGYQHEIAGYRDGAMTRPHAAMCEAWSYIDVRDAARAFVLALTPAEPGAHTVFIAAPATYMPEPTEELLSRYAPHTPRKRPLVGHEVAIELVRARELLGFEAHYGLQHHTDPAVGRL